MRSLYFLLAAPALLAQAPPVSPNSGVDYDALRKELGTAIAPWIKNTLAEASGKPERVPVDLEAALKPVRTRSQAARGEELQACRIVESMILVVFKSPDAKASAAATLRDVSADSPAWKVAPSFIVTMARVAGMDSTEPYLRLAREKGIPDVRKAILSAEAQSALARGTQEQKEAAVAAVQKEFPDSREAKQLAEALKNSGRIKVGMKAPDFSLANLDVPTEKFSLSSFKGKYLLMDFWGTWCTWCIKELPTTHKLFGTYKDKGLVILSLAVDTKPELVTAFRKKPGFPMPWNHTFLNRTTPDPVLKAFNVQSFPTLFLVGPEGTILAMGDDLREASLEKTLARFLK